MARHPVGAGRLARATAVGFYGLGTASTSLDDQATYGFRQPHLGMRLDVRPTRGVLVLGGGAEWSRWSQRPSSGPEPSVEDVYPPADLPGLGARPVYLHLHGTAGLDWRPAAGYARRGGAYGVTWGHFRDHAGRHGFRKLDLDAVQHVPLFRDAWVLSLHGRVESTEPAAGQAVPFFMLPALGGGRTLRGFHSWRFRDHHALLLSAEWRVLVNGFIDTAVFYDAGKVTARARDLDLRGLKSNVGIGVRIHGPSATPIRIDLARSNEGWALVLASSAVF